MAVHNIVVLDNVFALVKVKTFNFLLGTLQTLAYHAAFDWRVIVDF